MKLKYNNISWLIFDFDGVIGRANQNILIELWSKELNISNESTKNIFNKHRKRLQVDSLSIDDYWDEIRTQFNINNITQARQLWVDFYTLTCTIDFELLSYIGGLKSTYHLCLLSNTSELFKSTIINKMLDTVFDVKIYSYSVGHRKPDPDIYEIAFKQLNCKPENCLFIDNLEKNLVYPAKKGAITMKYLNFIQFKNELTMSPD